MTSVLPPKGQKFEMLFVGYTLIGAIDFGGPKSLRERTSVLLNQCLFSFGSGLEEMAPHSRSQPEMG
jgi:hypothetical protein